MNNSVHFVIKLRCHESMSESYEKLLKIPGVMEIIEASNFGRGLLLNIKGCKVEIEKLDRGAEASRVGIGRVE